MCCCDDFVVHTTVIDDDVLVKLVANHNKMTVFLIVNTT